MKQDLQKELWIEYGLYLESVNNKKEILKKITPRLFTEINISPPNAFGLTKYIESVSNFASVELITQMNSLEDFTIVLTKLEPNLQRMEDNSFVKCNFESSLN
jgi:hypothetical protein